MASTRPQRSNANRNPAAPLLEGRRTRRSTAEVASEKAEIEAKRQALLKQNDDNLRQLRELERHLDVKEKENATQAARPPPSQPVSEKPANVPSTPRPRPRPHPASMASGRATAEDDSVASTPIGQRVQPGRIKRLRREDLEAYRESDLAIPTGTPGGNANANSANETAVTEAVGQARATAKKRKSEATASGGGDNSSQPTKKGKPSLPSGPTAAATAKFSTPLTATPPSANTAPSSSSAPFSTASNPQGVYTTPIGGFELDDADATMAEGDRPSTQAATPGPKNILQLEVVDVAATAATSAPPAEAVQPPPTALTATPRGGQWSMRHLEPLLSSFIGNFTHIFVPKLINFVSNTASGPWKLTGVNLIDAMKDLAAQSFPEGLVFTIAPRQAFYEVAKQKLSEYRNGVGNEAVEVVGRYMQSRRFQSADDRATYVAWATHEEKGFPFRYERITQGDDGKMASIPSVNHRRNPSQSKHGLYKGTLIAETFAYHLSRIGKSADQIRDHPCNALALTTAAVERALKMWRTGSFVAPPPRTEEAKFSDRAWGGSAQQYLEGISNLSDEKWDKILAKADRAFRGYNVDSEDELDDEQDPEDIPLTGRAGIDDDDDESEDMDGVEMTGVVGSDDMA